MRPGLSGSVQSRSSSGLRCRALAEPDRRDRGGDDDPLRPGVQARAQDPEGSLPRGHDQLVGVLRLLGWEWRGDVQDVLAARNRLGPALVAGEVRGEHRQPIAGVHLGTDRGSHLGLPGEAADRRSHRVAAAQELDHAPAAEKAGATGDQNRLTADLQPSSAATLTGSAILAPVSALASEHCEACEKGTPPLSEEEAADDGGGGAGVAARRQPEAAPRVLVPQLPRRVRVRRARGARGRGRGTPARHRAGLGTGELRPHDARGLGADAQRLRDGGQDRPAGAAGGER